MKMPIFRFLFCLIILLFSLPYAAHAAQYKAVDSVTVLAEPALALPMARLASAFARENLISISVGFSDAADQKKKIENAEAGDMIITSDNQMLGQLKVKGLVDVYSVHEVIDRHKTHYVAAVIAGENMTQARKFMAFLRSDEGKDIIAHAVP